MSGEGWYGMWVTTGGNIYYNSGNVGIGTATLASSAKFEVWGNAFISNGLWFNDGTSSLANATSAGSYSSSAATGDFVLRSAASTKLLLQSGGGASAIAITSTGNVGIGTATVSTILDIYKSSYTGPLLCLDTGVVSAGAGVMPQAIGKPLLRLGKLGYSQSTGDYYGIGFGYAPLITDFNCAEIGTLITSTAGNETGDLVFSTRPNGTNVAATERMRITSTGNVGIGTATIQSSYKLQVQGNAWVENQLVFNNSYKDGGGADYACNKIVLYNGSNTPTTTSYYGFGVQNGCLDYFSGAGHKWYTGTTGGAGYGEERMRIDTNGNVVIGGNVNVGSLTNPSDSRIKKDIEDINDESALNKLLLIQPTTYNYIDVERNKGFGKVYGFIAQQIREVIPEAVPIIEYIIPNIYKRCLINNKREVYHSIPLDTPIDTSVKIDDTLYKIKEVYEGYFVIDNDIDTDDAFVFGYSVNDFHTLDKTYIFTLNVCATQELHRRIETQSVLLKSQDDRIKDLETKVATLMSSM